MYNKAKNYVGATCYSPTMENLLDEFRGKYGKPQKVVRPAAPPRSTAPSATVTSASASSGASSAPFPRYSQPYLPSGPPGVPGRSAPPPMHYMGLPYPPFYGPPPHSAPYVPRSYPGFAEPPAPMYDNVSSAESEDDEPPARYILTDFAKKWAPDMVKDSAPVDEDPQACTFGFSDAVPHSPPGLVQADDGLCGAFLRGGQLSYQVSLSAHEGSLELFAVMRPGYAPLRIPASAGWGLCLPRICSQDADLLVHGSAPRPPVSFSWMGSPLDS